MSVQRWLKTTFSSLAPLKSSDIKKKKKESFLEASHLIHRIIPNVVSYCVKWLRDQSAPAAAAAGWRLWRLQTFCSRLKVSHFCLPGSRTCVTQKRAAERERNFEGGVGVLRHTQRGASFWTWNHTHDASSSDNNIPWHLNSGCTWWKISLRVDYRASNVLNQPPRDALSAVTPAPRTHTHTRTARLDYYGQLQRGGGAVGGRWRHNEDKRGRNEVEVGGGGGGGLRDQVRASTDSQQPVFLFFQK